MLALMVSALGAFAQQWETVKMDSTVSFKLPKGFVKNQTDSTKTFSASTPFGTILIFKDVDNPMVTPDIDRDRHLSKYYNDYLRRVENSVSDGKITGERDTTLSDLKVKDFTLEIDTGGGVQLRKFRLMHANNATYVFEFLYQQLHQEYAMDESVLFFNSITVNENVHRENQFNQPEAESKSAEINPYFIGGGVLLVILIAAVVFFARRSSAKKL